MRYRLPFRALLLAALSTTVLAQVETKPADLGKVRATAEAAIESKDYAAAAAAFKTLTEADAKDARSWLMLGYALHAQHKLDEALPVHMKAAEFKRTAPIATYNVACVYALQKKPDEAFMWLDKAIALGFDDPEHLKGDTDFEAVRNDPRFAKAIESIKAKATGKGPVQAFAQNIERRNTRVAWFGKRGGAGQIAIDYSPVSWQDDFEQKLTGGEYKGKKWRLGADFWTRLDTSVDLQLGGVAVPAGYYYLTLEQRDANTFVLALHDPAAIKKQKLDAFQAEKVQGGIEVPMTHATDPKVVKQLELNLAMNEGSTTDGTLQLGFGGHRLTAPFAAKID